MTSDSLPHWCDARATLPRLLVEQAGRFGAKPLLRAHDGDLGYAGLADSAAAAAGALERHGCVPGEMAAIFLPNGRAFVQAWFASLFAGLADAPVNTDFRKSLLAFTLTTSCPAVIFTDAAGLEALRDAEVRLCLAGVRLIVIAGTMPNASLERAPDRDTARLPPLVSFDELLGSDPPGTAWERLDAAQLASVRYTSGTTGPAKGAMQSHLHILNKSRLHNEILEMTADDVLYSPFPLHHNLASINGLIGTLQAGATMVSSRRFSASAFWPEARAAGATVGHVLYPLLPTLLAQPPSDDDRRHALRSLWMGWPHPEFEARFATRLVQIYALGEVGVVSWRRGGGATGAAGRPIAEMEVRIVDGLDRPQPAGVGGEIVVRPRQPHRVMLGYLNNLPATVHAFRNLWFHTGDAGSLGEDGELHFTGRLGDTIRRRGTNISADQLESEVLRHGNVRECAVIGVPAPFGEEDVHLCVVWRREPGDAEAEVAELLAFMHTRLPRSYVPRYVECLPELPKTETGKVKKGELRQRTAFGRRWDREAGAWR